MNRSLVKEVHRRLEQIVRPGDLCLDATAGNGLDALFLARRVGQGGKVHAMDVQQEALSATEELLRRNGLSEALATHLCCHSKIESVLPPGAKGALRAVTFNLGYLPKGDKSITTEPETTLPAIRLAHGWLAPGGVLSALCYRGHPGGREEEQRVNALVEDCGWESEILAGNDSDESPVLHWVVKT